MNTTSARGGVSNAAIGMLRQLAWGLTSRVRVPILKAVSWSNASHMDDEVNRQDGKALEEEVWVAISAFEQILDALPNDTTAATRARIVEVLGGAPVSERW